MPSVAPVTTASEPVRSIGTEIYGAPGYTAREPRGVVGGYDRGQRDERSTRTRVRRDGGPTSRSPPLSTAPRGRAARCILPGGDRGGREGRPRRRERGRATQGRPARPPGTRSAGQRLGVRVHSRRVRFDEQPRGARRHAARGRGP